MLPKQIKNWGEVNGLPIKKAVYGFFAEKLFAVRRAV
jgi:hypothetical protein